jgi:hypothetical protein
MSHLFVSVLSLCFSIPLEVLLTYEGGGYLLGISATGMGVCKLVGVSDKVLTHRDYSAFFIFIFYLKNFCLPFLVVILVGYGL